MYKKTRSKVSICLLCAVLALELCLATGCSLKAQGEDYVSTKVVLTTGFNEEEVFRISKVSCTVPEIMVYLTNMQNQYENVYGTQIWSTSIDGVTLEQKVKDTVIARIAQVKTMSLLAEQYEVTLSDKEMKNIEEVADAYYSSLNETEIAKMGITKDTITELYREFALANLVYDRIIQDVNPEISDDEARTITVQQILLKNYTLDADGNKVEDTDAQKAEDYALAQYILKLAREGEDFAMLAEKYSEDNNITYSFGKGEMEEQYEEVSFNLDTDEISDIIETSYGYCIMKCVSTFDVKETDANKEKIVKKRKKEAFNDVYNQFVNGLTRSLNEEVWDSITLIHDENVTTKDFFSVFEEHFTKSL
jgi:foldase protein PrsA